MISKIFNEDKFKKVGTAYIRRRMHSSYTERL